MAQNDNDLVKRMKNGDKSAFKDLYLKYSDLLYAYIMHHLDKDKDAASDIWQETWIVFVEKNDGFQNKSSIFTWLCGIAKNKISDYHRNTKKQDLYQTIGKLNCDIEAEEMEIESIDSKTCSNVITVLARMTTEYRYLLEAKYIENKSTDEISCEIGKSYKATESLLTRARESFRKQYKQIKKS